MLIYSSFFSFLILLKQDLYVAVDILELCGLDPLFSASQVLGLMVCITTLGLAQKMLKVSSNAFQMLQRLENLECAKSLYMVNCPKATSTTN